MTKKWTFDEYLGSQLKRIAFVKGGKFNISDVKKRLLDTSYLNKLYHKERPNVSWNWDSYTDRMNGHIYRVVKSLGGARGPGPGKKSEIGGSIPLVPTCLSAVKLVIPLHSQLGNSNIIVL